MSGCAYCGSLLPHVVEKDGFHSETSICVWGGRWCIRTITCLYGYEWGTTYTPIGYCPFCGRSLKDVTPPEPCIDYRTVRHIPSWQPDADERDAGSGADESTSDVSGSVARTLLEAWEDMA